MTKTITFQKTSTGHFAVLVDGQTSEYAIVNGSLGLSGRNTENVYGVVRGSQIRWIGSLAKAKKAVALTLTR